MILLVTGSAGFLGRELCAQLGQQGHTVRAGWLASPPPGNVAESFHLDVTTPSEVARGVEGTGAIIHTAYRQRGEHARRVNVDGSANVARAAEAAGARLLHISSDVVFDGHHPPYDESDKPSPLVGYSYGQQKVEAEMVVARECSRSTVIRTSLLYGSTAHVEDGSDSASVSSLERMVLQSTSSGTRHFTDEFRCPVHVADLAAGIVSLLEIEPIPVVHLAGPQRLSRYEIARELAPKLGLDSSSIQLGTAGELGLSRPSDLNMSSELAANLFGYRPRLLNPPT